VKPNVMSFKVAFVGAGEVNFGGIEAPWDHASRIEQLSQNIPLEVVAIVEPLRAIADKVMEKRRPKHNVWKNTQIFANLPEMLKSVKPDAIFIGVPPNAHGEIEDICAKNGIHMFIEKPIYGAKPEGLHKMKEQIVATPDLVVSVGYMLRYHSSVQFIKKTLKERNLKPVSILARYNTAYPTILKAMWWDMRRSGGPIIEQGTHFCDLLRYFGGDVDLTTVHAVRVSPNSEPGTLSLIPKEVEKDLPEEFRIPRATHAVFKFKSGAIGSLSHGVLQHGTHYLTEFEIWCDGLRILLHDPYTEKCHVYLNEERFDFAVDDPYLTEDQVFLEAISKKSTDAILSPYSDAVQTYELTYAITHAVN